MSPPDEFQTTSDIKVGVGETSDQAVVLWIPGLLDILVSEFFAPGTHTVELSVGSSMKRHVWKTFNDCSAGFVASDQLLVGWEQIELDGSPCFAASSQVAVLFDTSLLDRVENKVINRAVLHYDEVQAIGCNNGGACWTSGSGQPEDKPNGCIDVRIPSTDWTANPPSGEFPTITSGRPAVNRLGVHEWDVTEPFRWQTEPGAMPLSPPTGPGFVPGFGFLLTGGLTIDQLEAEDNTNCLSVLTNISLRTTYTVFKDEPFHDPH
jgi:hypothetical protein